MRYGTLDDDLVEAALTLAVRAPSVHNTQPWRFRITDRGLHLYLDPTRALPATDPDQRDLLLSCGAVLHHLRVALAAQGWSAIVDRLPDPSDPDHLATLELVRHRPTMTDLALCAAIARRRTDRRHYTSQPIPPGYLSLVTERAAANGAVVRQATYEPRRALVETLYEAARRRTGDPGYQLELAEWSGRHDGTDGVPAANTPRPRPGQGIPSRAFAAPRMVDTSREPDYAELLVIGTAGDDRETRLRAGEAVSAVLLTATNIGLSTCLLTEPLGLPDLRRRIRTAVLGDAFDPQAVIRIGWPDDIGTVPVVPRRAISEVLDAPTPPMCGTTSR
ncbi:Acg family FMN-binding oxidoreductase [Nocardia bovistercoris]|uniref:NAD(P)H nitroreductase n=1 Tax=Nocardia bovistercoris TaxID=2785916 RepID=A0A931IGS2_9NOCA|nr:NAD(P)H nitroreductase [Nocardia bovistercoris]MBH0781076.1 NAD(P)H nitroreductase [Nocardia bovistercoris]